MALKVVFIIKITSHFKIKHLEIKANCVVTLGQLCLFEYQFSWITFSRCLHWINWIIFSFRKWIKNSWSYLIQSLKNSSFFDWVVSSNIFVIGQSSYKGFQIILMILSDEKSNLINKLLFIFLKIATHKILALAMRKLVIASVHFS